MQGSTILKDFIQLEDMLESDLAIFDCNPANTEIMSSLFYNKMKMCKEPLQHSYSFINAKTLQLYILQTNTHHNIWMGSHLGGLWIIEWKV